ncbi:chemotaxis-specific protein-glutamate methyltransferase CheB [Caulobacter segnis]|uniref:chemotaxis-specific protein-glutamate methyltransferase CheB n=1 Tax=Caulobacter segnis TaxID=88688 RepID=UPI002410262D|nr:chemotaxis-specific protein-glutamate methyltransferase CheB [Caulobacter segnis]MDG2522126.1 chemotaxis-specific protein-glutamate methyltransferase CheB [Caulobacter segnis]
MIKVLIVDDSPLMRRVLGEILSEAEGFELAFARDGIEALQMADAFSPDVITLDVQMPRLDGLQVLERLMVERPRPVVMVSSLTQQGAETTLNALERGAIDFVPKPGGPASLHIDELAPLVVDKVRAAAAAQPKRARALQSTSVRGRPRKTASLARRRTFSLDTGPGLIIVGASTGGPPALEAVLGGLPEDLPWPVVVAQHMPAAFTGSLARRLDGLCELQVLEVIAPTVLETGRVYIARGDADMIVSRRGESLVALPAPSDRALRWHPSVDRLAASALANLDASKLIGVLLTGMGDDGAASLAAIRQAGGRTIAQSQESAVVWGMPGVLARLGGADEILDLEKMADQIVDWISAS